MLLQIFRTIQAARGLKGPQNEYKEQIKREGGGREGRNIIPQEPQGFKASLGHRQPSGDLLTLNKGVRTEHPPHSDRHGADETTS
jgi:hypothetical protein